MRNDVGASALPTGLPINEAASLSSPSVGIPSAEELMDLREAAEMASMLCDEVRLANERITGGNCAFVDDDLRMITHLAERAVEAGLTDRLHWRVRQRIADRTAQAMETGTAKTEGLGAQHDSAVAASDAPPLSGDACPCCAGEGDDNG